MSQDNNDNAFIIGIFIFIGGALLVLTMLLPAYLICRWLWRNIKPFTRVTASAFAVVIFFISISLFSKSGIEKDSILPLLIPVYLAVLGFFLFCINDAENRAALFGKAEPEIADSMRPAANFDYVRDFEEDTNFDYEESAFSGRGSSARSSAKKSTPRGFEQHHPDDEKFWNVVNDPAASNQERKTALAKIMKREKGKINLHGKD